MLRIATCQYQIEVLPNWDAYQTKIETIVKQAHAQGAQLLLLPEYAGIEVACKAYDSVAELFAAMQPVLPRYIELFQRLAKQYQLYIQPGTTMPEVAPNQYANRAYFFSPSGEVAYQDKLKLVEVEKTPPILVVGNTQTVFDTALGKIGIAICYDSEFPQLVTNLTRAGAELILVPSFTASIAGYYRVSLCSRARAVENQCYTVTSLVIGEVTSFGVVLQGIGCSGVFGPVDNTFPDDGIVKESALNKLEMIIADIDLANVTTVRQKGSTHNFEDTVALQQNNSVTSINLLNF